MEAGQQYMGTLNDRDRPGEAAGGLTSLLRLGARLLLDEVPAEAVVLAVGRLRGARTIESACRDGRLEADDNAMRELADGWLALVGERLTPSVRREEGVIAGRIGEPDHETNREGVWRVAGWTDRRAWANEPCDRSVLCREEAIVMRCQAGEAGWLTGVVLRGEASGWTPADVRAVQGWGTTMRSALSAVVTGQTTDKPRAELPWAVRIARLSPTERRVLAGLVAGRTERQIAGDLKRSPNTVHVHVKSIYLKLGVNGRDELDQAVRATKHEIQPLAMPHDGRSTDHDVGSDPIAHVG